MVKKAAAVAVSGCVVLLIGCPGILPGPSEPPTGNTGLTGKFIGSETCQTCHTRIHADWSETLHSGALATLEAIGEGQNPECLRCHTVGFDEEGGFVSRATTNALAGVGCEACHGPARDHVENVADNSLRPKVDISAEVCGSCHTGQNQPHFDEWVQSRHSIVTEVPAEDFTSGVLLGVCGQCHSGDYFVRARVKGESVPDELLVGVSREQMNAVECAVCHNPHSRTGNAVAAGEGRDFQLRFPEVTSPIPTNTISAATDASRFNLCGQCHHSRGRTWQTTSRAPHESVQVNVFTGEMPLPEGTQPLVLSRVSVHSFATEQCATCHMFRQPSQSELAPAIAGHTFQINNSSCATSGCHPTRDAAIAAQTTLQTEMQTRLDDVMARLGDPAEWEYTANGGPDEQGQDAISDEIKKIRFLFHYVLSDGSRGVHNPNYVRSLLEEADRLLTSLGR